MCDVAARPGACRRGGFRGGRRTRIRGRGNRRPTPGAGARGGHGHGFTGRQARTGPGSLHQRTRTRCAVLSGAEWRSSRRATTTATMRQRAGDASPVGFARAVRGALDGGESAECFIRLQGPVFFCFLGKGWLMAIGWIGTCSSDG